jgi:hypothetical protein
MCQLVTTTTVEGDGLRTCESHTQGYDHTHSCCVCFGMAITDIEVKVLLWNFHVISLDMLLLMVTQHVRGMSSIFHTTHFSLFWSS